MIVIDASAMVELLRRSDRGLGIADRLAATDGRLCAPHLIDPEVMQAFRELARLGEIQVAHAEAALAAFTRLPLERAPHDVLWSRMWELRHNLKSYDATYVALAELRDCPLFTCDGPLARAPGNRAKIELF